MYLVPSFRRLTLSVFMYALPQAYELILFRGSSHHKGSSLNLTRDQTDDRKVSVAYTVVAIVNLANVAVDALHKRKCFRLGLEDEVIPKIRRTSSELGFLATREFSSVSFSRSDRFVKTRQL